ncbi:hypothetical protein Tco_0399110, partial [Tanacetum coccineum]
FVLGHSSTNDGNTANVHVSTGSTPVSTGSTPVSTASTKNSTACLSDATVYAYLATQPNGSQVVHEDLDQSVSLKILSQTRKLVLRFKTSFRERLLASKY